MKIILIFIILVIIILFIFCIIGDVYISKIAFDLNVEPECNYKKCINITTTELNIVKIKVIINWILFCMSLIIFILYIKDFKHNNKFNSLLKTICLLIIILFMGIGGIFISMLTFTPHTEICNTTATATATTITITNTTKKLEGFAVEPPYNIIYNASEKDGITRPFYIIAENVDNEGTTVYIAQDYYLSSDKKTITITMIMVNTKGNSRTTKGLYDSKTYDPRRWSLTTTREIGIGLIPYTDPTVSEPTTPQPSSSTTTTTPPITPPKYTLSRITQPAFMYGTGITSIPNELPLIPTEQYDLKKLDPLYKKVYFAQDEKYIRMINIDGVLATYEGDFNSYDQTKWDTDYTKNATIRNQQQYILRYNYNEPVVIPIITYPPTKTCYDIEHYKLPFIQGYTVISFVFTFILTFVIGLYAKEL